MTVPGLSSATAGALARAGLDPSYVAQVARTALDEDLGGGQDVSTVRTVPRDHVSRGEFTARQPGVVAGLPVVAAVLETQASELPSGRELVVRAVVDDGDPVAPGDVFLVATGPTRALLTAERTALNLLTHLSGIATLTRRWVDAVDGTPARIRDTRKTTPGLRALEKYAVRCGGGLNHRLGLSDAVLVKDNHVAVAGGVAAAFAAVYDAANAAGLEIEVECDTLEQVGEALAAGAGLVLLDNMAPVSIRAATELARRHGARVEASGGLTLARAYEIAATGVDFLAVGALTHSAPALDIGLDLSPLPTGRGE